MLLELSMNNPLGLGLVGLPMVVTLALFGLCFRRLPRNALARLFMLFVASLLAWQLFDVAVRGATNAATAAAWRDLLRMGQFLAIASGLHFALRFSHLRAWGEHPVVLTLLYAPPLVAEGLYSSDLIREELGHVPIWGWIASPNQGPLFDVVTAYFALASLLLPAVLYLHAWHVRHDPKRLGTARLLALGISVPVGVGVLTEGIFPVVLGLQQIPLTSTTMVTFSLAAAVAVYRDRLLEVDTLDAARTVIETVSDGLVIFDGAGRVRFANDIARRRFRVDDKGHLKDLFRSPTEAVAFASGAWRRTLAGERHTGLEVSLKDREGADVPALVSLSALPDRGTGVTGVVLIVHDVSVQKAIEAELAEAKERAEDANDAKSMFMANMSHELRTPLNAILGYAQLLGELAEDDGNDELRADLRRIETSGAYLLGLIDDVLDLSKLDAGGLKIRMGEVDLTALVSELQSMAEELCTRNDNELFVEAEEGVWVSGDGIRVRQIVINLVSNAAKFTTSGTVWVRVHRGDGQGVVVVQDSGIGMNAEQVASLFGVFTQVHDNGHEQYGGSGLGLALSHRLCRLMGGDITVKSTPGEGSTFTVEFQSTVPGAR